MAINGVTYSGKEVQVGFAEETTFGTPIADNAAFTQLVDFGSITVEDGLTQDISVKNRAKYIPVDTDSYTSQTGGVRVITISDIVVRLADLPDLLYAVHQNVTEDATTPYSKEFGVLTTSNKPDFATSGGYFCTIGIKNPIAGYDEKYTSCICTDLKLKADMVGGDGRLRADATFISGFAAGTTSTFSGTWSANTATYFDFNKPTAKTMNAVDVVLYSFEVDIKNNGVRVGCDSSGDAETYNIGNPEFAISGSLVTKYDANTKGILADYLAGTARVIEIATGTSGNSGYLDFNFDTTHYTGAAKEIDRAEGYAISVPFVGVERAAGPATPAITVADASDRAW